MPNFQSQNIQFKTMQKDHSQAQETQPFFDYVDALFFDVAAGVISVSADVVPA